MQRESAVDWPWWLWDLVGLLFAVGLLVMLYAAAGIFVLVEDGIREWKERRAQEEE